MLKSGLDYNVDFPDSAAWQIAFRKFGGIVGVSESTRSHPDYFDWSIGTDGRVRNGQRTTAGKFILALDRDAVDAINRTIPPAARIGDHLHVFGAFPPSFWHTIASAIQAHARARHLRIADLAFVRLALDGAGVHVIDVTVREAERDEVRSSSRISPQVEPDSNRTTRSDAAARASLVPASSRSSESP
jgi:hypothetical protein